MYRYASGWFDSSLGLLIMYLLVESAVVSRRSAEASCVEVPKKDPINRDLLTYSCEGGTVEDLKLIPDGVERIRISKMPVARLTDSLFSRFGNLVVLVCSECEITDVDENAFRSLGSLQQLSLNNNKLTEVKGSWFQGLDYLSYLDLNYNDIEHIEGNVFRNAPDLIDLRLSGNRLLCLDLEALSRLKGLKRIYVNGNPNFSCFNAFKKFLTEQKIDYEVDSHWDSTGHDRVRANKPLVSPNSPSNPAFWYTRLAMSLTTPTPPSTYYHRWPHVLEETPSSEPSEFTFHSPYYSTLITRHRQLGDYWSTHHPQYQQRNETTLQVLLASQQFPVDTAECLLNRGNGAIFSGSLLTLVIITSSLGVHRHTLNAW